MYIQYVFNPVNAKVSFFFEFHKTLFFLAFMSRFITDKCTVDTTTTTTTAIIIIIIFTIIIITAIIIISYKFTNQNSRSILKS